MAKSADEVLKELANGEITTKDILTISSSKTETAEILNKLVDKLGGWEALKGYAKYLAKKNILNKKSTLMSYLGEKKAGKKVKTYKQKEEGESESEESEEEEELETDEESEGDIESEEEEEEGGVEAGPMLSKDEYETARLLAERIKREKEQTTAKKEPVPREPVVKYTTKPAEGGEIPIPIPAVMPVESNRFFNMCKKEYRSAVWLNSTNKRVTVVYTDDPNYGTNVSVKYGGKVWYMVNDLYFKLQCTSGTKKEYKDDGLLQFTDKDGNTEELDILYGFSDGTYAKQTRDMFNLETNYFIEKFASPTQRKDLLTARPFSLGSETTNFARSIGKSKLALIPNSEEVELSIANDGNDNINTYFKKIANFYVFLDEDSVFAQRLQMNYYKNVDVLSLPISERIDYPELAAYYEKVAAYELGEMGWELYYLEYVGGKDIKRIRPEKPAKPVIEGENKDGKKIEYKKSLFSIENIKRKFQKEEYTAEDEGGKSVNFAEDTEFIRKIMNMNTEVVEKPKEKKVRLLDIFDILKVHLQMLRNGEIPKLDVSKSPDVCDYCDKHVGEKSEFKSVVINDDKETEIVKYCSINCFNKSPEE